MPEDPETQDPELDSEPRDSEPSDLERPNPERPNDATPTPPGEPQGTSVLDLPQWLPLLPVRLRWAIAASIAALTVMLSVIPRGFPIPETGGTLPVSADKIGHFLAYLALTFMLIYALVDRAHPVRAILLSLLVTSGLGLLLELVQATQPTRAMETADLLANLAGTLLAGSLWALLLIAHPPEQIEQD